MRVEGKKLLAIAKPRQQADPVAPEPRAKAVAEASRWQPCTLGILAVCALLQGVRFHQWQSDCHHRSFEDPDVVVICLSRWRVVECGQLQSWKFRRMLGLKLAPITDNNYIIVGWED